MQHRLAAPTPEQPAGVNAIKHAQAAQVTVSAHPLAQGAGLRLVVADDGVGIETQALSSLQAVLDGRRDPGAAYERSGLAIGATIPSQSLRAVALATAPRGRVLRRQP